MKNIVIGLVLVAIVGAGSYFLWKNKGTDTTKEETGTLSQTASYAGKKILYVDSYNSDYDWSIGIERGIRKILAPSGAELKVVHMDTKKNPSEESKVAAGIRAKTEIDAFQPDVLLVSDDNAFKYLVMPYYKDASLPVVFSGLNWDAAVYGAPYSNTTGMVEVSLTNQIIDQLRNYAKGSRLGYLSADTETERKNLFYYDTLLNIDFEKSYFVKTMDEWKEAFLKLQEEVDIVIFENNAGISAWNEVEAADFVNSNIKVPVGTTNLWMMKYSLLGINKSPDEQGEWQASAALKVLDGTAPRDIPLVQNKLGSLIVNLKIADKLGVTFSPSVLKNAQIAE